MSSKKKSEIVKEIIETLLRYLEFDNLPLSIKETEEGIAVDIQMDDPGILIGFHGETLSALQLIVSLIMYKNQGQWTHVSLNVGDYRQKRESQITQMVDSIKNYVKETKTPRALPYLSSIERRIVHLFLQDDPDVKSESEGEGQNRRVIIKPREIPQ